MNEKNDQIRYRKEEKKRGEKKKKYIDQKIVFRWTDKLKDRFLVRRPKTAGDRRRQTQEEKERENVRKRQSEEESGNEKRQRRKNENP